MQNNRVPKFHHSGRPCFVQGTCRCLGGLQCQIDTLEWNKQIFCYFTQSEVNDSAFCKRSTKPVRDHLFSCLNGKWWCNDIAMMKQDVFTVETTKIWCSKIMIFHMWDTWSRCVVWPFYTQLMLSIVNFPSIFCNICNIVFHLNLFINATAKNFSVFLPYY